MYVSEELITSEIAPKQVFSMTPILPLPIFTTPEGFFGIDYAESGRDIFVVNEGDMVRSVNSLLFNETHMEAIVRRARATIRKYCSRDVNGKKLSQILTPLPTASMEG
jgi:hypothetical protein